MSITKDTLIQDALCYLKDNFSPKDSLLIQERHLKAVKKPLEPLKEEPLPDLFIPPPPIKKQASHEPKVVTPQIPLPEEKPIEKTHNTPKRPDLAFEDFKKVATRLFPHFALKETPPDDRSAVAMTNPSYVKALKANTVIFSFQESPESDLFLQNIRQAIASYHGSACIFFLSSCKTESELSLFLEEMQAKLILAPPSILEQKTCLPFVKNLPVSSEYYLHNSRLVLLEPFIQYFTYPKKKKILWQTLCNLLQTPNTPASS